MATPAQIVGVSFPLLWSHGASFLFGCLMSSLISLLLQWCNLCTWMFNRRFSILLSLIIAYNLVQFFFHVLPPSTHYFLFVFPFYFTFLKIGCSTFVNCMTNSNLIAHCSQLPYVVGLGPFYNHSWCFSITLMFFLTISIALLVTHLLSQFVETTMFVALSTINPCLCLAGSFCGLSNLGLFLC